MREFRDVPNGEPIHLTIYRDLLRKIEDGELQPGDRVPSEAELQQLYEVSRTPVRQALGRLQTEGLIERRPGRGSFVQSPVEVGAWGLLSGFGEYYRDHWDTLDCRTLVVGAAQAQEGVAGRLGLNPGDEVVYLKRLRLHDQRPVVLLHHYLPATRFSVDEFKEVGDFFSVRAVLRQRFNVTVRSATEDLTAVQCDPETAQLLRVNPGSPLLRVDRISYDFRQNPIQVMQYLVRSDLWHYRAHLGLTT